MHRERSCFFVVSAVNCFVIGFIGARLSTISSTCSVVDFS